MSAHPPGARIRLQPSTARPHPIEPITVGLPVPRAVCHELHNIRVSDQAGRALTVQAQALERWSDGSVRWALLDFQAAADDGAAVTVTFAGGADASHPLPVQLVEEGDRVRVSNEVVSLLLGPGPSGPILEATAAAEALLAPGATQLLIQPAGAAAVRVAFVAVAVECRGPMRAAVRLSGLVEGTEIVASCRFELFAGSACVKVRVTLHNPQAAHHPGGFWELGDPGSVFVARAALVMVPPPSRRATHVVCAADRDAAMEPMGLPFRLHQESSGRANWQSPVHVTRSGALAPQFRGYRLTAGAVTRSGLHASPIVHVDLGAASIAVASRLFWEVFPIAYQVDADATLSVELLPADGSDDHELQGGEKFSRDLGLAFGADATALEWVRSPVTPVVEPRWWADARGLPYLSLAESPEHPYERLIAAAIDGDDTFVIKRDRIDEYGWRHYGDLYADHENSPGADPPLRVSHYNNQYDGIAGLLTQFARSGDVRWWALAQDLACHVRNVDIYWTDRDKSAFNGGLFWHTYHYVDAGRASHRSYPKLPGVPGGGTSVEHNYATGLMLHYLMTGDPDSREAALRLARWTADMDDGTRTVFRFLSRGRTGLASATGQVDYHGPGRGPANAIATLLSALRLTGDVTWLHQAEELIRRCVHPEDDLVALQLLDAERRWYYTVMLQALGAYLGCKTERGEEDATWHYARATLLHYARWMVPHEYPYLDKPEVLEYPTETWAAQDMRKCEVFNYAAVYAADAAERGQFTERARYFFQRSVTALLAWPSRTWTRPVVLMLSYGHMHLWHEAHRETLPLRPAAIVDFGVPTRFEAQKSVALRRAKWLVLAAGAAGAAVLAAVAYRFCC